MATVVRRKRKREPEDHPLYDALNDLGSTLGNTEIKVARDLLGAIEAGKEPDPDVLREVVRVCEYVVDLGRQLARSLDGERTWTPLDLYNKPADYRQVLLLEAFIRAVVELEQCESSEAFQELAKELETVRKATWGNRPWRNATDPKHFEQHVLDIARAFTGRPTVYPNRARQPLDVTYDYTPGAKLKVYVEGQTSE